MIYCLNLPHWSEIIGQWLYDWQTLVAGILALFGAGFLYVDMKQSGKFEAASIRRKHQSRRAVASLTLSQICTSARTTLKQLADMRGQSEIGRILGEEVTVSLSLPDSVVPSLQSFLETTDDEDLIALLFALITKLQITITHLEGLENPSDHDIEVRMLDVGQVYALSECLFEYARREADFVPTSISWDRVRAALNLAKAWQDTHPNVHELLDGHAQNNNDFWPSLK